MPSAGVGKYDTSKVGAVPTWRLNWMPATSVVENTARVATSPIEPTMKLAGAGLLCLILRMILVKSAVLLWVVNKLVATTLSRMWP